MSHHKDYGGYYPTKERATDEKREEVQTTEPVAEAPQEETKAEEQKVEEPASAPKPVKKFATVTGGKPCKMRFKPDKKAQVINIIPHRAKVTILNEAGEWWKVTYKGITGYMMSQFLKKE